jgi:DNA-binding response OmpR family regulator
MPRSPRIVWIAPQGPALALREALVDQGYTLLHIEPGPRAERACAELRPDALLVALDDTDITTAQAAVGTLRQAHDTVLLVLTPTPLPLHEVLLLEAGADAVAALDGSSLVLLARLRRLLKRPGAAVRTPGAQPLRFGCLEIDSRLCLVRVGNRALDLGSSAIAMVHELAQCEGAPASRAQLARHLGSAPAHQARTVDMAICRLRHALRTQGVREMEIQSVRGYGYRLVARPAQRCPV